MLGVEGQNRKEGPEVPFYALRSLVAKLRFSTSGDKMSFARVFGHSEVDVSVRISTFGQCVVSEFGARGRGTVQS